MRTTRPSAPGPPAPGTGSAPGVHELRAISQRDRLQDLRRAAVILGTLSRELARLDRPAPLRLRLACEKLGVTFIKAAQIIASTYGIVPDRYAVEFRNCFDNVPPMSTATVEQVIERSYGRGVREVFEAFDEKPLASASVAQVHRARLRGGTRVVVKVKRPDIEAAISRDLALGYALVRPLQRRSAWAATVNLQGIVEEFERTVTEELDFRREQAFMTTYGARIAEVDPAHIFVPRTYEELSNSDVLVLEEVDGIPLSRPDVIREQFDAYELLARLLRAWFEVMVRHGLYHGDLHAGNVLFVKPNRVALVDFGIVGVLDPKRRRALLDMLVFSVLGDDRLLARHYKDMGFVPAEVDDERLRARMHAIIARYVGKPLEEQRFEDLFPEIIAVASELGGAVPREVMLLTRQQIYLAAHGRLLAPGRDILRHPLMLELLFPRSRKQYIPAPVSDPRYRLPMPGDKPSPRALACPVCKTVIESQVDFEADMSVYCYACFTNLKVAGRPDGTLAMIAA
jgi:ubiquinone biosynthesis protein